MWGWSRPSGGNVSFYSSMLGQKEMSLLRHPRKLCSFSRVPQQQFQKAACNWRSGQLKQAGRKKKKKKKNTSWEDPRWHQPKTLPKKRPRWGQPGLWKAPLASRLSCFSPWSTNRTGYSPCPGSSHIGHHSFPCWLVAGKGEVWEFGTRFRFSI